MEEKNPTLKPQENEKFFCKFKKIAPFKEGHNDFNGTKKPWFGYNVIVQKEGEEIEYTWFASEAVHRLIGISEISADEVCSIEFSHFKNNDGKEIYCWKLNDKTFNQYKKSNGEIKNAIKIATADDDINYEKIINNLNQVQDILKQHAQAINSIIGKIKEIENK